MKSDTPDEQYFDLSDQKVQSRLDQSSQQKQINKAMMNLYLKMGGEGHEEKIISNEISLKHLTFLRKKIASKEEQAKEEIEKSLCQSRLGTQSKLKSEPKLGKELCLSEKQSKYKEQTQEYESFDFEDVSFVPQRQFKIGPDKKEGIPYTVHVKGFKSKAMEQGMSSLEAFFTQDLNKLNSRMEKLERMKPNIKNIILSQLMGRSTTEKQRLQSQQIRQELVEKHKEKAESTEGLILGVYETLKKNNISVVFSKRSTVQSQISMKCLLESFASNVTKCSEVLGDGDPENPFSFEMIQQDPQYLSLFESWYKQRISRKFGIESKNIQILNLARGSIKVEFIYINDDQAAMDPKMAEQQGSEIKKNMKLHPYFSTFSLSPEDFDTRGNFSFFKEWDLIMDRGGWPYYQPQNCKRYGLRVWDRYDEGDNEWLKMDGNKKQWAVTYHGVVSPEAFSRETGKFRLNSIMEGVQRGQMLKPGIRQMCRNDDAINKPGQKVGRGIYCTPHMEKACQFTSGLKIENKDSEYALILQCRANPKAIKVTKDLNDYWVVNNSKDIRPYGIILIKEDIMNKYRSNFEQYGECFQWERYKDEISKHQEQQKQREN